MSARLSISLHAAGVRRGKHWALQPLDLELSAGQRWALVGGNGAGKTHLLKLLSTDLWPTPTGEERRSFRLGRTRIDEPQAKTLVAYLGPESQDKYTRLDWNFPVRDILIAGVQGTDIVLERADRAVRARVRALLRECALAHLASRRFLTLSYGQKRLVLLARTLARRPHWLLLDEPYNGLDERTRQRFDAILARARRRGQAWVVSAHRDEDIPAGTQRLVRLEDGRLLRRGIWRGGTIPRRRGSRTSATSHRVLREAGAEPGVLRAAGGGSTLISLRSASLYVDYHRVLEHVDWDLRRGEHWAVSGANGAGKSSFLRLLYGDLAPAHGGTILRAGFAAGTPIEEWKCCVGFVSPELQSDYAVDVSVRDLVISGRYASVGLNDAPDEQDVRAAQRWIAYFDLGALTSRRPRELSYGQLRRALLARALAAAPRLLLLDEPLTGLDAPQRAAMRSMLSNLMERGITLVMAVHHAEDLPTGITHVLHLHKRRAHARMLKPAKSV